MGTYSYAVSRFVPDPIRDEPINIGVVVVDAETGKTAHKFMQNLRGLRPRCPGADLSSLEKMIDSMQIGDMPGGADDLKDMARVHTNLLQFTPPRAVVAPSLEDSLQRAFGKYVGEAYAQAGSARSKSPRRLLLAEISTALKNAGVVGKVVTKQPVFAGRHGRFVPDRGVSGGGWTIALHAVSFVAAARTKIASVLRDAKALAVDFEDARPKNGGLEFTVVAEPPTDGVRGGFEMYTEALGHLEDRECKVVERNSIGSCAMEIGRRLGSLDQFRRS